MKEEPDEEHAIPIIDCPYCGEKDVALHLVGPYMGESGLIRIWFCPSCSYVPYSSEYKGFISLRELEEKE